MAEEARRRIRIGDLLVEHGLITAEQLQHALAEQKRLGLKLGRTLVQLGYIGEEQLLDFLARQLGVPHIDLRQYRYRPELVRRLPETYARRFRAIVLAEEADGAYLVGMADPTDLFAYDEIRRLLGRPVRQALVRESDLLAVLDQAYRHGDELSDLAQAVSEDLGEAGIDLAELAEGAGGDAPVVRLIQTLFEDAVRAGASDIHVEPDEGVLRLRLRIDGVLQEQVMKEVRVAPALVSRLKLMSGLDISEKRLPQDGRFQVQVQGRRIDVRLSTMPVQHGEAAVMRLLDPERAKLSLEQLGMPQEMLGRYRRLVASPHGMVLVTGPTGSGKTTTLYATLAELNRPEKKIITVEDPVEYRVPRVNQVQVNFRINLTFAGVLRAALRQDPDILLVGEMRDQETMQIGLRAAMTGHFVLSTLHTNDAVATASRLIDMGGEGYLVAAALRGIVAQRLVRRVCDACRVPDEPLPQTRAWLEALEIPFEGEEAGFVRGRGCPRCNNTGYRGRIGVYELLEMDAGLTDALRREDMAAFAAQARQRPDYRPLVHAALDYARVGVTSLEEVMRVAGESVAAGAEG
ncbi:GspE/PulE family protein [Inmirania thermothiophila]|uniref:MSHA biogenesis protein MshE n=1 Tax=Inmirania thermothiophila TaxID=1750597 RepID=A0A3N1Y5X4_9GAMM|nr:GspE/PulE family protein [Inmirania thermothiophila]ROR34203.1 MSHA biogenesis protein MshE [Inmirania thermothiophila]